MTPREPERASGLSTHGYGTPPAIDAGSHASGTDRNHGTGSLAARNARRVASLFRLAEAASGGLPGRPSARAARAAITVGRSPTASTPDSGASLTASTIVRTERSSSWNRTGTASSHHGSSS